MRIKKAILTGGGRATRLRPITTTINKHLIPLANKPMIFHAIEKAVEAGIEEIFINVNPGDRQLPGTVGDGARWGIKITYYEQTGGPQGIAHVVKCGEKFIGRDPFMFFLSDNIFIGSLKPFFEEFEKNKLDLMLAFARVGDPRSFGVPRFDKSGNLLEVVEKPANPDGNLAQTGIYLYGGGLFFDAFKHSQKSARGEYEISDVDTYLIKNKRRVGWREVTGWWKDTGKPDDLLTANQLLLNELKADDSCFELNGTVHAEAKVGEKVHCGVGSTIGPGVIIHGPVMIGENCTVEDAVVGPYVTIGAGSVIRGARISNSIIFSGVTIEAKIKIDGSLIGESARVVKNTDDSHRLVLGDHTLIEM